MGGLGYCAAADYSMSGVVLLKQDVALITLHKGYHSRGDDLVDIPLRCQVALAHEEVCFSVKCDATPDHHTPSSVAISLQDTLRDVAFPGSSVYPLSSGLRLKVKPRLVREHDTAPLIMIPVYTGLAPGETFLLVMGS